MGQKVNPYGFRLGFNKGWKSLWFERGQKYADTLLEDLKLRSELAKIPEAQAAEVANVEIVRQPSRVTMVIHTSRPGVIIGAKGATVEKIQKSLQKFTTAKLSLKMQEIRRGEIDAQIVALNIAKQLKGRSPFRRVVKMAISSAMRSGVSGVKIRLSGRLGGAEMSRSIELKEGRIPLHTLRARVDYGFAESFTTYGSIGVKVWMFHGEMYRDKSKADAGAIIRPGSSAKDVG